MMSWNGLRRSLDEISIITPVNHLLSKGVTCLEGKYVPSMQADDLLRCSDFVQTKQSRKRIMGRDQLLEGQQHISCRTS